MDQVLTLTLWHGEYVTVKNCKTCFRLNIIAEVKKNKTNDSHARRN